MPTLDTVISQVAGLRYALRPDGAARTVLGVWRAGRGDAPRRWEDGRQVSGWRGMLALIIGDPGRVPYGRLVAELSRADAAGIVIAAPAPDELLSAGRAHHLAVVQAATAAAGSVQYLAQAVADLRDGENKTARLLLEHATTPDAGRLVMRWLAETVDGQVLLASPYQVSPTMLAAGQVVPAEHITALAEGDLSTRDLQVEDDLPVRLTALDTDMPRHVLVVARRGGWPPPVQDAISQASRVLASWLQQTSLSDTERVPGRAAVLQMLLDGQLQPARRAAGQMRLAREVLFADEVRVCVISVRSTLRDAVMAALHHDLGGQGLVTPSTSHREHIVVVLVADDRIVARLRAYLSPRPWAYAGISGPKKLSMIEQAQDDALLALPAASNRPDRWAQFAPLPDLAAALPNGLAHRWQQSLLQPLESLTASKDARDLWLETTRLVMAHGSTVAAQVMEVNDNTVRRRATAVADVLGLDLGDFGDCIVLDLALRIRRLRLREPFRSGHPTLGELLETPQATEWARDLLSGVPDSLLHALIIWLDARAEGSHAVNRRAAERLGIAPKTLRRRLHEAEAPLGRTLVTSTPAEKASDDQAGQGRTQPRPATPERGIHDLALAAHIAGVLPRPILTPRHAQR